VKRVAPAALLRALPAPSRPLLDAVLAEAERCDAGVSLVGGPVRDYLLGRPLRDVDLIVEPEHGLGALELARAAAAPEVRIVAHDRFGTVRLETLETAVDLATVRSESYAHPGALPTIAPGTLEQDLRRRDFTANALAVPLSSAARRGRPALVDIATGSADLEAKLLRIFHERSFHDDPTRALRSARLAPRLGFSLTRGSLRGLRSALRDGAFGSVSGERFRAEFEKLFADAVHGLDPAAALRLLASWHVLPALEPGLGLDRASVAPLRRLGRAVAQPPWRPLRLRPWLAGLMVWLAPLEASLRRRALRRLAVQGEAARAIEGFPKTRDSLLRRLARCRGRGAIDAALRGADDDTLLALFAWAPPNLRRRIERFAREDRFAELSVGGDDLVAIGLRGPAVGRALAQLRIAYLDRRVRTREEALALARELGGRARARR
jgi:tRNA nucleotidyltransferase (CCA-adding enzyme)